MINPISDFKYNMPSALHNDLLRNGDYSVYGAWGHDKKSANAQAEGFGYDYSSNG